MNDAVIRDAPRRAGRPKRAPMPPCDAVRLVRDARGETQVEFARTLKCSELAVRKCENERRLPGSGALRENFARLAKRAGVALDAVIERADANADQPLVSAWSDAALHAATAQLAPVYAASLRDGGDLTESTSAPADFREPGDYLPAPVSAKDAR